MTFAEAAEIFADNQRDIGVLADRAISLQLPERVKFPLREDNSTSVAESRDLAPLAEKLLSDLDAEFLSVGPLGAVSIFVRSYGLGVSGWSQKFVFNDEWVNVAIEDEVVFEGLTFLGQCSNAPDPDKDDFVDVDLGMFCTVGDGWVFVYSW